MDGRITAGSQRYVFFSEEFERIMLNHEQHQLSERITKVFVNHSLPTASGRELFLYWTDTDKHLHALRVSFSFSKNFPARQVKYINENNIVDIIPGFRNASFKKAQEYFSMTVDELTDSRFDEPRLLNMWFTMNGFIGELRHVQAGQKIGPDEAMRIYEYFAGFFQIENTYVCDDVMLQDGKHGYQVPLRVIAAIATGKTWFERHMRGLKLIDVKRFAMTANEFIQQDASARLQDLADIQSLSLEKWHEMLDEHQKPVLMAIYERNMPKRRSSGSAVFFRKSNAQQVKESVFGESTLMNLTEVLYKEALVQKTVTADLWQLYELLSGHVSLQFGSIPLDRRSGDYWVKSRVQKLLWSSCLWYQVGVSTRPVDVMRHSLN